MTFATKKFYNRIALVFDFDETLAPGTLDILLESLGHDPQTFRQERIQTLMDDGWEEILARGYALIEDSKARDDKITADYFAKIGQDFDLFDGVESMFDHVRDWSTAIIDDIEVEFYMLTAGFVEIPQATSIAKEFNAIWGGAFHFNEQNEIVAVKRIVTHPEKVRYILQLAKGLGTEGANSPSDVYKDIPEEDWHVPLSQIIYVGDGSSDMPAFSLMNERRGLAIGVFGADKAEDWEGFENMDAHRRVQNLAPADYSEGSELMESLQLAVESICKRIALRCLSIGE